MTHKNFMKSCNRFDVKCTYITKTADGRTIFDEMYLRNCRVVKFQSTNFAYTYDGAKQNIWGDYGKNSRKEDIETYDGSKELIDNTASYNIFRDKESFTCIEYYMKTYSDGAEYTNKVEREFIKVS